MRWLIWSDLPVFPFLLRNFLILKHVSMRFSKTRVKEERSFHRWRRVEEKTGRYQRSHKHFVWNVAQGRPCFPEQDWKRNNWKRSVFIPIPKKGNAKECSNYRTNVLISHSSKIMIKILQARLQQYVNRELPGVQAGFRKGRGTRDQIANICWIMEKQESSRKISLSTLLTMPKPLTVWITINCGKFWKRWEYQTTWPAKRICRSGRNS